MRYGALGQTARAVQVAKQTPREHPLWVMRQAQARRLEGDPAGGLAMLEAAIGKSEIAPLPLLRRRLPTWLCSSGNSLCHAAGSSACAHDCSIRAPGFDDFGFCNGVGYAYVLQRAWGPWPCGETVLDAYLIYVASRPRLGFLGLRYRRRRGACAARASATRRSRACARPSMPVGGHRRQAWARLDSRRRSVSRHPARRCPVPRDRGRGRCRHRPDARARCSSPRRAATGSRCSRLPRRARDASRRPRAIDATHSRVDTTRNARPV